MDSIAAAESGHLGLPLGAAEIGAVLWGEYSQVEKGEARTVVRVQSGPRAASPRMLRPSAIVTPSDHAPLLQLSPLSYCLRALVSPPHHSSRDTRSPHLCPTARHDT